MPRRASPCRREAVEAVLRDFVLAEPTLYGALEALREIENLFDWRDSPLGPPLEHAAVLLRAAELVQAVGCSEKDALDRAAIELGVSPDTTRTRGRDWPKRSRRCLSTPTRQETSGSLNQQATETTSEAA